MNSPLSIIISLLLFALVIRTTIKAKGTPPPHGGLLLRAFALTLLQAFLFASIVMFMELAFGEKPYAESRIVIGSVVNLLYHLVRFTLIFFIFQIWIRISRPSAPLWLMIVLYISFFLGCVQTERSVILMPVGLIAALIIAARSRWTEELTGFRRFYVFIGSLLCIVLLMPVLHQPIDLDTLAGTPLRGYGMSTTDDFVLDNAPGAAIRIVSLVPPIAAAILTLGLILWIQVIATFYKLMAPRLHLRKLALKRRFAVTYALIILLPGLFCLVAALVMLYMGAGSHKAALAKGWLDETIEQNVNAAGQLARQVEERAGIVLADEAISTGEAFNSVADMVVGDRQYLWKEIVVGEDSTVQLGEVSALLAPGLPDTLLRSALFGNGVLDSVGGILVTEDGFYLAGGVARTDREGKRYVVEAYVELDSLRLASMEKKVGSGLSLQVLSQVMVQSSGISSGNDTDWTESEIHLVSSRALSEEGAGFLARKRELSTSLLPAGEWLHYEGETRRGGISLKIISSIDVLLGDWFSPQSFVFMRGPAMLLLVGLFILFATALRIVLGTGRGIVGGLIADLGDLYEGAARIGKGDFDYKVPVRGKDEVAGLSSAFNDMGENLKQHQKDLLEKERLEADLAVARDIQKRLLPQESPSMAELDVAGISLPSKEVGGDLFYFLKLPHNYFGVAIGDVSGKSVPAALLMSNVLAALKTEALHEARTHKSLANMNDLVVDQVEPGRFVTFFYGVVDPASGKMRYACAGHNPTLIVNADGEPRWLEEAGLPLGVMAGSEYVQAEEQLLPDDILVLYSDGVTEAERPLPAGAEGEEADHIFFEEERLVEAVRANRHKTAGEIMSAVLASITEFTQGAPRSDDLTLVIVKVAPV